MQSDWSQSTGAYVELKAIITCADTEAGCSIIRVPQPDPWNHSTHLPNPAHLYPQFLVQFLFSALNPLSALPEATSHYRNPGSLDKLGTALRIASTGKHVLSSSGIQLRWNIYRLLSKMQRCSGTRYIGQLKFIPVASCSTQPLRIIQINATT